MKRALNIYKLALMCEIYGDELALELSGINKVVDYKLIRVHKVQGMVRKFPRAIKFGLYFLSFIWPVLFFTGLTANLLYLLLGRIGKKKQQLPSKHAVLLLTPRMEEQVGKIDEHLVPELKLSFTNPGADDNHMPLVKFYTTKIILKAYISALLSFKVISKLKVDSIYRIQTYTAYKWFLTWYTLKGFSLEEIWFGNHYDRWAVLCEYLPVNRKVFVQHGLEDGVNIAKVKFRSVEKAYLINVAQKEHFEGKIFGRSVDVDYLKAMINLSKLSEGIHKSLLIVGNFVLTFEEEKYLISNLQTDDVEIYVKPHPVLPKKEYYQLLKNNRFNFIEDKATFPEVDLVISYESTLGIEYEAAGIRVLYYSQYRIEDLLAEIRKTLTDKN